MLADQMAFAIALTLSYFYNYYSPKGFVHVEIDKGILRGLNFITWRRTPYFSFRGIPYAKPPVGEFRFKAPQEETAWAGVRDALRHGEVCSQVDIAFGIFRGQEDCLFLNVYTTTLRDERLPVMVWFHGGMFKLGSGNDELYGPDYLIEAGVVLVTVNFRLGALGFLTTGDDGAPGNAGLKDQVASLRWVRRNIARFGGDPDNVTIFGGSSGAVCVHYHVMSPMSSGLFARAISQSGSVLNTWALTQNGPELTIRLAESLGANNLAGDTAKALEFLKAAPYEDIVRAQETLMNAEENRMRTHFLFVPTVEKGVTSEEVFLPESPLRMMKSGNFNKVPFMTGYTGEEALFLKHEVGNPEFLKIVIADTVRYVPIDIEDLDLRNDIAKSIRKFYFDDKPVSNENMSNFVNLCSDVTFVNGVKRAAQLHIQSTDSPTYFFVFAYDGGMNTIKLLMNVIGPGVVHGDELGYLFHQTLLFWRTPVVGSTNEYVSHTMIRLWTNFAKYGNPTPAGDPLTWKPATIWEFNYLNISGRDMKLGVNPEPERTEFWAKAYAEDSALRHPNNINGDSTT